MLLTEFSMPVIVPFGRWGFFGTILLTMLLARVRTGFNFVVFRSMPALTAGSSSVKTDCAPMFGVRFRSDVIFREYRLLD